MNNHFKNEVIAIAKGLGIALVVLGHCTMNQAIKRFIYLFHMPLFFIISGFLFRDVELVQFWDYVLKKIKRLYIPFVVCNLVAFCLRPALIYLGILEETINFKTSKQGLLYIIQVFLCIKMEDIVAPLWFLPILMYTSILFALIRIVVNRIKITNVYQHLFIALIYVSAFMIPTRRGLVRAYILTAVALGLFDFGWIIRIYKDLLKKIITLIAMLGLLALYYGSRVLDVNLIKMQLPNPFIYFIMAGFGTALVFWFAIRINLFNGIAKKFLVYAGDYSLVVLEWHYYAFSAFALIIRHLFSDTIKSGFISIPRGSHHGVIAFTAMYVCFGLFLPLLCKKLKDMIYKKN